MVRQFHPHEPVSAKPLHSGTIIYADDTCIRAVSSEHLGGGSIEGAGGTMMAISFILWLTLTPLNFNLFLISTFAFSFLIILPILFFRYKPNYLILSRKSQEIYYIQSPKLIVKMKWEEITGEYRKVTVFTGSGIAQIDTLRLNGTSQYRQNSVVPASLPFVVADENHATQLWAYLQAFMKNGSQGIEAPSYDRVKQNFWDEVKRITKLWFYDVPYNDFYAVFSPKSSFSLIKRVMYFPVAVFYLPFNILLTWPGSIATSFVESTRKRAPFPEDLLPYITDNPEKYGKVPL